MSPFKSSRYINLSCPKTPPKQSLPTLLHLSKSPKPKLVTKCDLPFLTTHILSINKSCQLLFQNTSYFSLLHIPTATSLIPPTSILQEPLHTSPLLFPHRLSFLHSILGNLLKSTNWIVFIPFSTSKPSKAYIFLRFLQVVAYNCNALIFISI